MYCFMFQNAIEAIWHSIKDLLQSTATPDSRATALQFLKCLLEGQVLFL
jgi:hypothetical protein